MRIYICTEQSTIRNSLYDNMPIICWIKDFMKWERSNGSKIKNANALKDPELRAATSLLLFDWFVSE